MSGYSVFIGIGSNVGDATDNCIKAVKEIGLIKGNRIVKVSSLYMTEPISHIKQDWFINCVVKIETDLTPYSLLSDLQKVEKRLGRKRDIRHGPRTIDLDILIFNSLIIDDNKLKIPHPRMHERRFVLEPLSEIDENLIHPVIKKSIKSLLNEIGIVQRVELLRSYKF